ncbi:unnamed protein product [Acanthoscelides obtectus]|uniref:Uncharacterized protein n=1 Tax=Acanthoscelides obtectus TaxID=200917 RepID=A0A9P0L4E2_ACAOB|nr:unnamed protein product [Acanthoscelides obtectus]CAK1684292.1 Phorbol ester/diacylglycerol-binding protein unc-13 [Acanthoscelides obtectus]
MIWDRALGYHWIPLHTVHYSNEEGCGQWRSLEAELVMRDGEVVGTKTPTGHSLLVDCRFELPFDPENIEALDLQRKLEMLNNIMDQEARAEQARRQMHYLGHSGHSEDSDYTSDLNYPVGGQHANSSASQFRAAAGTIGGHPGGPFDRTPDRSLETSRENSYDDGQHTMSVSRSGRVSQGLSPDVKRKQLPRYLNSIDDYSSYDTRNETQRYQDDSMDSEPLFYNSRPYKKNSYTSCESSFHPSIDSVDIGYSVDVVYGHQVPSRSKALRRPSLERQSTLYDDPTYYGDTNYYPTIEISKANCAESSINVQIKFKNLCKLDNFLTDLLY